MTEEERGSRRVTSAYREETARTRRYVLGTIAFLCLALIATQLFLNQTSVGSPRFLRSAFLLNAATVLVGLALLVLATVLGRNLIKLYFERKSGQVGSLFKTKIVSIFVGLSLLPAVLLFFLAYGLVNSSIQQWFGAPADQMLEYSKALATQYYDETRARYLHFAELIAAEAGRQGSFSAGSPSPLTQRLDQIRSDYMLDEVRVFDRRARLVAAASGGQKQEVDASRLEDLVARTLEGQAEFRVDRVSPQDALKEIAWATAPIRDSNQEVIGAVLTQRFIPESAYFKAYSVMEAYTVYKQLQRREPALRYNYLLILVLSTLLIVFAFSWFAMYLSKRITVPIQALAEGAAAVAGGNLGHRVECVAFDELDSLVQTFNRMTAELQENKKNIEAAQETLSRANIELDDRRRYIETILQTIATGVISLDGSCRVRTLNPAAVQMLGITRPAEGIRLDEVVPGPARDTLRMLLHKSTVLGTVVRNIELNLPGKALHLATTVTPLVDGSGERNGWVLVLDDLTELLKAEKMAAWQEVARRLAHEIKNPLTPIQLSAERLLRRYRQIALAGMADTAAPGWRFESAAFGSLLEECVRTIIREADSLKSLVDEFSRFARLPQLRLVEADLRAVLESALSLYNGRLQDVRLQTAFDPEMPLLRLDPEQMKRVVINLVDNALEAMADGPPAKILSVRTSRDPGGGSARIEISDTGPGFPGEYRDSLFLPYFSRRKGGTGLGLAIVRQIVTDHAGQVRAEPNHPRGTKIIIDLPLVSS